MPSSPSRASPAQNASSSSLAATEPLRNVTSLSPETPNSSRNLGMASSSEPSTRRAETPCVCMILLASRSPIMLARLRTASGSATLTRILIRKAAGWAMMGGCGLRKTTPATITIGGSATRTQNIVFCAGPTQGCSLCRVPSTDRDDALIKGLKTAATFALARRVSE